MASAEVKTCIWPGCDKERTCMCEEHWKQIPAELREQLNAWYAFGTDTTGYLNTVARVRAWVQNTFGAREERRDHGKWERLVRLVREKDAQRRARREAVKPDEPVDRETQKPWRHLRLVRDDE